MYGVLTRNEEDQCGNTVTLSNRTANRPSVLCHGLLMRNAYSFKSLAIPATRADDKLVRSIKAME